MGYNMDISAIVELMGERRALPEQVFAIAWDFHTWIQKVDIFDGGCFVNCCVHINSRIDIIS